MSRAMAHSKCIIAEAAPTDLALLVQVKLVKVEISATIARFNERRFVSPRPGWVWETLLHHSRTYASRTKEVRNSFSAPFLAR